MDDPVGALRLRGCFFNTQAFSLDIKVPIRGWNGSGEAKFTQLDSRSRARTAALGLYRRRGSAASRLYP